MLIHSGNMIQVIDKQRNKFIDSAAELLEYSVAFIPPIINEHKNQKEKFYLPKIVKIISEQC